MAGGGGAHAGSLGGTIEGLGAGRLDLPPGPGPVRAFAVDESHTGPTSARLVGNWPWAPDTGLLGPRGGGPSSSLGVRESMETQWLRGVRSRWSEQSSHALAPLSLFLQGHPPQGSALSPSLRPAAWLSPWPLLPGSSRIPAATQTRQVHPEPLSLVPRSLRPSCRLPEPRRHRPPGD